MKLTIEQIKTIIKAAEKAEQKKDKEISELVKLFLDKVFEQTYIRNLKDLKKIIVLYDSYKENDWFKQGLEKVLLEGQFPCSVSERTIIKEIPATPIVYPSWPNIWNGDNVMGKIPEPRFGVYCNAINNDSFKELEDFIKEM